MLKRSIFFISLVVFVFVSCLSVFVYRKYQTDKSLKNYEQAKLLFELSINTDNVDLKNKYRTTISKIAPNSDVGYFATAFLLENQEDFDLNKAMVCYNKAIEINPQFVQAYVNRARLYLNKGDYELAIMDTTRAIALDEFLAEAYINRAEAYRVLGRIVEAEADLLKAGELQDKKFNENSAQMANPASANCINLGGRLDIRKNSGGEYGICIFENGKECEEWALFRGECGIE
ncbi:MAG: hypothetical protein COU29_04335 [Candidatus Magasanikbacteria bacterium CG10_big_fil_rev_8_21_14_0_10_36_32]|uniref:Uncharacterized protein n=1 Tax=Candidatus Magasanikbacteria bacterium CG10_big_fil_rev_8_21_14_0_10_36_32 TaxID=1974646 RepID=A0A2M6W5E3_9BACT|nr:MAG: hypothetical protein COU29_04335 [Candidatus Magasanikbacteria bacterium CG10_big_fil_rev_8_21_14_0_10_36_32]